jgi:acetoin utilization protein AcuB
MTPNPVTVDPKASVDQALGLMRAHGVRHLPVMEGDRIVGLVTDHALATAWFPSLLEDVCVADVMDRDPTLIEADETIYQAARLMYNRRLTGLLVVEDGRLVGIITMVDLLKVFVSLMGLLQETVRLEVAVRPGQDSLEEIHSLIRQAGGEVVSVALLSSTDQERIYSFRLERTALEPITQALAQAGFRVLV